MGSMLPYIAAPWILWVFNDDVSIKENNNLMINHLIHHFELI